MMRTLGCAQTKDNGDRILCGQTEKALVAMELLSYRIPKESCMSLGPSNVSLSSLGRYDLYVYLPVGFYCIYLRR